jgi:hypothetical protein
MSTVEAAPLFGGSGDQRASDERCVEFFHFGQVSCFFSDDGAEVARAPPVINLLAQDNEQMTLF